MARMGTGVYAPGLMSAKRIGLTALLIATAFSGGALFSRPLQAGRFNPYQKLGIFSKVLSYIETHYVEDISETELMYGAARGLTDVLDPHSRFMDPEEYDRLKKETEGNEEINGIGIDVEKRKNRLVIISPIEGSPAAQRRHRAGRRHQARRRRRGRRTSSSTTRSRACRARPAARWCW